MNSEFDNIARARHSVGYIRESSEIGSPDQKEVDGTTEVTGPARSRIRGAPSAECPQLVPVTASLHRTPAPGARAGRVDEHQRAVAAGAFADTPGERPGQQFDHLPRQGG